MSTAVTHVDDKVGRDPFRSPRHSCFVIAAFLRPRKLVIRRHGDAGSAAFQLRRRGFFFEAATLVFCRHGLLGRATLFCFAATSILCRRVFFLRSRDIGDSSLRPQARDCFVLPRPFLGARHHPSSSRLFFAAARHWGFFAAFWGRATLFALPRSFFGVGPRDIVCAATVLRSFVVFRRCGLLGPRDIVCAAGARATIATFRKEHCRSIHNVLFEDEFFGKPGSRVMRRFFSLKKYAAINQRNALLLSWRCAGWGFFLEKDFFGKLDRCTIFILFAEVFLESPGPKRIDAHFFCFKEEFFGKPGSRRSFFF